MSIFRILSIDGGGTRGVIPLHILDYIEKVTGKRIFELFDLIVGTSTGGLIACGLTVSDDMKSPKYQISDLLDIYRKNGAKIFPYQSKLRKKLSYIKPQYKKEGIEEVLKDYFGDKSMSDCILPLLVTSYNLLDSAPLIFRSRDHFKDSVGASHLKDPFLVDICRATSAAPVYFGSHSFKFADNVGQNYKDVTCVDGGVYINNPSLLGYGEILANKSDPIYNKPDLKEEDVVVLSLGTGTYINESVRSDTSKWGGINWIKDRDLIEVMMTGTSKITHENAMSIIQKNAFSNNYLRVQVLIDDEKFRGMDLSDDNSLGYYEQEVNRQLLNKSSFLDRLEYFLSQL